MYDVLERDFNAPSMHFAILKLPLLLAFAKTQYQPEMSRAFSDLLLVSSSTHMHSILDPQKHAGDTQAHDGYLLPHIFFLSFCPASYLPQLVLLPQAIAIKVKQLLLIDLTNSLGIGFSVLNNP